MRSIATCIVGLTLAVNLPAVGLTLAVNLPAMGLTLAVNLAAHYVVEPH